MVQKIKLNQIVTFIERYTVQYLEQPVRSSRGIWTSDEITGVSQNTVLELLVGTSRGNWTSVEPTSVSQTLLNLLSLITQTWSYTIEDLTLTTHL